MGRISGGLPGAEGEAAHEAARKAAGPHGQLIGAGEPAPFRVLNPQGRARVLVVCDHASPRIPAALENLGLDELALGRHIASDIGAGDVAERLAARLDAPAVLAGYSRLVVDCNRSLEDPTSILAVSDGEFIPGNQGLSDAEKHERARQFFHPYHDAIRSRLESFKRRGIVPAFVAVHSFTPVFKRVRRPWQIGILWDKDPRIPVPLIAALRTRGIAVGDNEPYSGKAPADHSVDHHAEGGGLPHVSIEIRQDLIDHAEGADHWAGLLGDVLEKILDDEGLYRKFEET
ncbi:MAG TPA: N-formylglutamate amidohydrolase [Gammaproteobacteria bacterium]|nr:N-formylglutamate amidohydrolase [Gammaproteobacteria bacterium]